MKNNQEFYQKIITAYFVTMEKNAQIYQKGHIKGNYFHAIDQISKGSKDSSFSAFTNKIFFNPNGSDVSVCTRTCGQRSNIINLLDSNSERQLDKTSFFVIDESLKILHYVLFSNHKEDNNIWGMKTNNQDTPKISEQISKIAEDMRNNKGISDNSYNAMNNIAIAAANAEKIIAFDEFKNDIRFETMGPDAILIDEH